jgi:predicted 3-demethylubiquinone-9 3-methyltransferase (glyoxalase superfamily)
MTIATQKITPFLWFDNQAEEAMNFYLSVFKNSRALQVTRYGDAGPGPNGKVMTVSFELNGQEFNAINGGPHMKITPAISFVIHCATQEEVDYYWDKLGAGGAIQQCGWLADKFGLSWQVVPTSMLEILAGKDSARAQRAMAAMMKMVKLDIKTLEQA